MNYRIMKGTDLLATIKVPDSEAMATLEDLKGSKYALFTATVQSIAQRNWPDETVSLYVDDGENPPMLLHQREPIES